MWHCSLSLRAREGRLSDHQWEQISEAFVAKMRFTGTDDRAPCRWVAVRHGLSAGGNDHVHIVVSLVREDGTEASTYNDRPRAQQAAGELEREFGLEVLESRQAGRGSRYSKPAERASAQRRGSQLTDRDRLERIVRAGAAAASDKADFVCHVLRAGARIRPRFARGRTDIVEGYSVALRTDDGSPASWYGGGRLARDLTLPPLRVDWPDTPEHASAAVTAWTAAKGGRHDVGAATTPAPDADTWRQCMHEVAALREQLRRIPADDRATWARVAHETAGVFAAWSLRVEPTPGPLAQASAALACSAQVRACEARSRRPDLTSTRGAARLIAAAAAGGSGRKAEAALLIQLANTVRALNDAHSAAGQLQRAEEINRAVRTQLAVVANAHAAHASNDGAAGLASGPTATPTRPGQRPRGPMRGRDRCER